MSETQQTSGGGLLDNVWQGDWERNEKIIDLNDGGSFIPVSYTHLTLPTTPYV